MIRFRITFIAAIAAAGLLILLTTFARADMYQYCSTPPFVTAGAKPNVLIILDNSNSMDEDFYGNAVGSYASSSKSVVAKKAIRYLLSRLKDHLRAGLMTYRLSNNIRANYIHNSPYFVSYNPISYCPNPPSACVGYCQTGDPTLREECENACQSQNSSFNVDYMDEIINAYPIGSEQRNRYCNLIYPKTQRMVNPTDTSHYIYYKHAYPMYSRNNLSDAFCYSTGYNPHEGTPWDYYRCYRRKTGTSDGYPDSYSYYWFSSQFEPTDTDYALGYLDFGRRLSWVYIGRTWFSNSSPGDGYLHVPIGDLVDNSGQNTSIYNAIWNQLDPKENDESGYMSCRYWNKNTCPYIINAGLTPTAGTLQTAIDYFRGNSSPIQVRCQKNFVIYVTDGLPSVDENGNTGNSDALMPDVLEKITALRHLQKRINGTLYTFDIRTYVLGMGLSDEAKAKLDQMAIAGGTAHNGHAYYADNPSDLVSSLSAIFLDILKRVASGTSVSILSERTKKGASLLQAVFYAEKEFPDGNSLNWIGYLYDYWYYNARTVSNIREDTPAGGDTEGDKILELKTDKILEFTFDGSMLSIKKYLDTDGDGEEDVLSDTVYSLDDVYPLWEAGKELFERSAGNSGCCVVQNSTQIDCSNCTNLDGGRNIFTYNGSQVVPFDKNHKSAFQDYLGNVSNVDDLIDYIRGIDKSGMRSRTVTINKHQGVWKLGDIVYSTPAIVRYGNYDVAFVGANDGMLHAFKIGYTQKLFSPDEYAKLCDSKDQCSTTNSLGKEIWAFIPQNLLPYLRYLGDPNYCHIYFVDLTPYVTEIAGRTVLIGGLRLGGGVGAMCQEGNSTVKCEERAVYPPEDTCPDPSSTSCIGLSSYFAIDISNPEKPELLWEFSHPNLGFSYSGPAVIHTPNDKWYVLFLSGPTDYRGNSVQNLHAFVLALDNNLHISNTWVKDFGSSYSNGFGGKLFTDGLDYNTDGYTDMVFFGFSRSPSGREDDWEGNVFALKIKCNSNNSNDCGPDNWDFDKIFSSDIEPVTAPIVTMPCFGSQFLYFGTGRYFYNSDNYDITTPDKLYGVRIQDCYSSDCNIILPYPSSNACSGLNSRGQTFSWVVDLEDNQSALLEGYLKERCTSTPTITNQNATYFTTNEPTSDICGFGGRTRVWGLNCATGEAISAQDCPGYVVGMPKGTILVQTSTGVIKKLNPYSSFTQENNKASAWIQGVPPETGSPFVLPYGLKQGKIIHWYEK